MAQIISSKTLSLAEVAEIVKKTEGYENKPMGAYIKAFSKAKSSEAQSIAEKLRALDNVKIKESHIVKVIDFMPSDAEDVHKIFSDVSMSEEEIQSILQTLKKS